MRALLALTLVLLTAALAWGAPVEERLVEATEVFRTAGSVESLSARRDAYRQAAERFAAVAADGHENAALELNTGNAYLLAGDHGRAILHLRRSLRLDPRRQDARANLATARALRRDEIDAEGGRAIAETVFFWHTALPLGTRHTLALVAWWLGFGVLGWSMWRRRRGGRGWAVASLLVAVALGASVAVELHDRAQRRDAVVVADSVPLRAGDGRSYEARYENPVHSGTEVEVTEERAGWIEVRLPDGKSGWVPASAVERI